MCISFSTVKAINNLKNNAISKFKHLYDRTMFSGYFNKILNRDIVEFSTKNGRKPVIAKSTKGISTPFDSGIKDSRFSFFTTEWHAFKYEGLGNKFPDDYVLTDSDGFRRLKPYIYINLVEIKPKYAHQGAYKRAIKKLVDASKKAGCEGRIILYSTRMEGPSTVDIPSPALAHWTCGFRFPNEEKNEIMRKILNGEIPKEKAPKGKMYYAGD